MRVWKIGEGCALVKAGAAWQGLVGGSSKVVCCLVGLQCAAGKDTKEQALVAGTPRQRAQQGARVQPGKTGGELAGLKDAKRDGTQGVQSRSDGE